MTRWRLSSSSDPIALSIVDGTGRHAAHGPHYSRRTPGSKTFTGCGKEIVLVTECERAVWACVYQRVPARRGSGASRGRFGGATQTNWVWRNNMFRNLEAGLSSELIAEAIDSTYEHWIKRYGSLPVERLRTEIGISEVRSTNPGYCYLKAGWVKDRVVRGKLYLWAPERPASTGDEHARAREIGTPGVQALLHIPRRREDRIDSCDPPLGEAQRYAPLAHSRRQTAHRSDRVASHRDRSRGVLIVATGQLELPLEIA